MPSVTNGTSSVHPPLSRRGRRQAGSQPEAPAVLPLTVTTRGDESDEDGVIGPAPRPAPRHVEDRHLNGAFDDRTGLFEGPAGMDPAGTDLAGTDLAGAGSVEARSTAESAEAPSGSTASAAAPAPLILERVPDWTARLTLAALALLPVLVVLAAAGAAFICLLKLFFHPFLGLVLLVLSGAVLYGLVVASRCLLQAEPARLAGADLLAPEHPRIWMTASEISVVLGLAPPERIVVDGGTAVLASRGARHRELAIGLPLLIGLDVDELRAAMTRELADQLNADRATGIVLRLMTRLELALGSLEPGVPRWLLLGYLRATQLLAGPVEARHARWCQERVDQVYGPGTLARARRRIADVRTAWEVVLADYLPLSTLARRRPSLVEAVGQILAARGDPGDEAEGPRGPRGPSAPSGPAGSGGLDSSGGPAGQERAGRGPAAVDLLDGGSAAAQELERSILVDDDPRAGWPEIVERAAALEAEQAAARLARAALTGGPHRPATLDVPVTLDVLLDDLAAGKGPALVEPLLRPAIPSPERRAEGVAVLEQHLTAFVATVLVRAGLARHVLSWTGPPVRERREPVDGWRPWDLDPPIAAAAASAAGAAPLRTRLEQLGADLHDAVPATPVPPPRVLSAIADAELCGSSEVRPIDLLIYDAGLLIAPRPADTQLRRLQRRATWLPGTVSPAERIVRLARSVGGDPGSLPGGWWIELGAVTMSQLRERRTGLELQLRLAGGAGVTVRATPATSLRGTPVEDLGRLLPGLVI